MTKASWDASADLVVVGFGAAGAATSITAADAGAEVILLEKQPASWHTPSTRASGGQVTAVGDAADALQYFDRCAGGLIPLAMSKAWVDRAVTVIEWLEEVAGLPMVKVINAEHEDWPGAATVAGWGAKESYPHGMNTMAVRNATDGRPQGSPPTPGGQALFSALQAATRKRERIKVLYEHAATRLIQDENGRVVGVEAGTPNGVKRFEARNGVVLTCGGYEWNDEMKLGYLRSSPMYFYGSPMNTGDGVTMAQAVGADLWHMNSAIGRAIAHFEHEGKTYNYQVYIGGAGYVFADKYGNRFTNEHMQAMARHDFYYELINYDSAKAEYPRVPCYWFFDARRVSAAPMLAGTGAAGPHLFPWKGDVAAEMVERGWLFRGDNWRSIAEQAGVADPDQAAKTIAEYNEVCRTKNDSAFGREPDSLVPLEVAPFYCMPLWPGGPNTSGGPRRNESAQIVNVYGEPIAGLYEAGELGEAIGALYPANGGNISDALCFGQIAAEHALGITKKR